MQTLQQKNHSKIKLILVEKKKPAKKVVYEGSLFADYSNIYKKDIIITWNITRVGC